MHQLSGYTLHMHQLGLNPFPLFAFTLSYAAWFLYWNCSVFVVVFHSNSSCVWVRALFFTCCINEPSARILFIIYNVIFRHKFVCCNHSIANSVILVQPFRIRANDRLLYKFVLNNMWKVILLEKIWESVKNIYIFFFNFYRTEILFIFNKNDISLHLHTDKGFLCCFVCLQFYYFVI